jgi:hypothetical protein
MLFIGFCGAAACFGEAGLLAMVAAEFAGLFFVREESGARLTYAAGALLDLVLLTALFIPLVAVAAPEHGGWGLRALLGGLLGFALMMKLWNRSPLPDWMLPARGIHARRLVAFAAIAVIVATGPAGYVFERSLAGPFYPEPAWVYAILLGLPAYCAPLWDVLIRD